MSRDFIRELIRRGICSAHCRAHEDMVERLMTALDAQTTGCPCTIVNPCHSQCTCGHPTKSGGCFRCARYGSEEQRRENAMRIAQRLAQ